MCAAAAPAAEDKDKYLRVGRQETLPAVGIKFRGLKDALPQPLPSLASFKLKRSDGVELEAFDFGELWLHAQVLGRWGCADGTLILARMALPVPADKDVPSVHVNRGRPMVVREGFEQWQREAAAAEWPPDRQQQWLNAFLGLKLQEPELMKRGGPSRAQVRSYRQPEGATPRRWIFLVSPVADPGNRLVFIYEAAAGADAEKSERGVLQSLASLEFYRPTRDEAAGDSEMVVRRDVKRADWSPEYIASREQIIKSIENLKGWWYLPTDNFIIVANLDNRKTIRILEENLEACRNVFTDFYPIGKPLSAVSVCRIFQTRDEYQSYVGAGLEWSAGMWVSLRKELVVSPMEWGNLQKQREMLVNVVYHEGFHQFIHFATGETHTAIWFNEGNATFFEGIDFKAKGRYEIGHTFRQGEILKLAETGLPPVESLLKMTPGEFTGGNRGQNYAMVWALTYFLRKGCQVVKKEAEYGHILSRYYDAVVETRNANQATQSAWAGVDLAKFNTDFAAFWKNPMDVKKADRADPIKYLPPPAAPAAAPARP